MLTITRISDWFSCDEPKLDPRIKIRPVRLALQYTFFIDPVLWFASRSVSMDDPLIVRRLTGCGPGSGTAGNLAFTKFFPRLSHRAQQCLPVFKIRGENLAYHLTCKFRHYAVQHRWRQSHFVHQARPIKIVGVP